MIAQRPVGVAEQKKSGLECKDIFTDKQVGSMLQNRRFQRILSGKGI